MESHYSLKSYQYELDESLIAQQPSSERVESRLLDFSSLKVGHRKFHELLSLDFLKQEKVLFVCNNTRVRKARLYAKRESGGKVEALLFEQILDSTHFGCWKAFVKPSRKLKPSETVYLSEDYGLKLVERCEGYWIVSLQDLQSQEPLTPGKQALLLEEIGNLPLPPYIKDYKGDLDRYQTVFASELGAAAAPTAGLHFDSNMIESLKAMGHEFCEVTLHVGPGTFKPIDTDDIRDYPIHREFISVGQATIDLLQRARSKNHKIVAIGTTSLRVLESVYRQNQWKEAWSGWTQLYLYPGQKVHACDYLMTNFHLPCSSLLVLVASLIGVDNLHRIYKEAIKAQYRFFSFGDTSILPNLSPCS